MSCGSPAVFCGVLRLSDGPSLIGYWTFPRRYLTVNSGVKHYSIHCCSLYLCHHKKSLVQFAELHLSTVVNFSSANLANESVTFKR